MVCRSFVKVMRKVFILGLLWVIVQIDVLAQGPPTGAGIPKLNFSGKLLEQKTGQPLMFASVLFTHVRMPDKTEGTFTDTNGVYRFQDMFPGRYVRVVSAVGFKTYQDTVLIRPGAEAEVVLPDLRMAAGVNQLGEVSVVEDREPVELAVDRLIFNVGRDLVTEGGSVLDALRQIPLLNVDVDGKISLRGSENFLVYINGKPSGFTVENRDQILAQIPASNIERIELITNPSAKYEAEGMAGILNIVTKQNQEKGRFGSMQLGAGWPVTANSSLNLNFSRGKWSFTSTLGLRHAERVRTGFSDREIFTAGGGSVLQRQDTENPSRDVGTTFSGNVDYKYHEKGSLGLTYVLGYRQEEDPEFIQYRFLDGLENPTRTFRREADNRMWGWNGDWGLNWQQKDASGKGEWSSSLSYSRNFDGTNGQFLELASFPDTTSAQSRTERNRTNQNLAFQIDRVQSLGKIFKLETGLRSGYRQLESILKADSLNLTTGNWFVDTLLTNDFTYTEWVNAGYVLGGVRLGKKWEAQAGLRAEHTLARGVARGVEAFNKTYLNFFPSAQVKFNLDDAHAFGLTYARRINRPSFWALNPFPDYSDPFSLRVGDPNVNPELTDNIELNFTKNFKGGHFLYASLFWREISNPFQRYITVDSLGVTTVRSTNFGSARNYGMDVILRWKFTRSLSATLNGSFFRNQVEAGALQPDLGANTFGASVRSMWSWKFLKKNDLQLNITYNAPMVMPQGKMYDFTWVDLAYKREILKGKATVTLNVSDIFDTRRFRYDPNDVNFRGVVYRKPQSRIVTVQFVWKFGNPGQEPQRRRGRSGGGEGGGEMDMGL